MAALQSLGTYVEKIRLTGACERIPRKLYIRASANAGPAFLQFYQRVHGQAGWDAVEVD